MQCFDTPPASSTTKPYYKFDDFHFLRGNKSVHSLLQFWSMVALKIFSQTEESFS